MSNEQGKAHDQTIMIFRLGSLGDVIVSLPCFHGVVRRFPNAKRIVLTNAPVSGLAASVDLVLGGSGLIDQTVPFSPAERKLANMHRLSRRLRSFGARTLIYLTERDNLLQAYRDWTFFRLSGFHRIIGAPLTRDRVHPRRDPVSGELEFEAERLSRSMAALGPIDLEDRASWDLKLTDAEIAAADACLRPLAGRPFVAVNPGGKEQRQHWGDKNWSALLTALSARHRDLALVMVGASPERTRFDTLGASWRGPIINAAGELLPRESAALLARASGFIGHDSGPMHLAACVGTKCLGLFGAGSPPHKWYPYGRGHRVLHDTRSIESISPDRVLEAVEDLLSDELCRV